jgi:cytochrome c-type biogenesis protein CcmE
MDKEKTVPEGEEERGQLSPIEELTGVSLPQVEGEEEVAAMARGALSARSRHGSGVSTYFVLGLLIAAASVAFIILDGADDAVFAYTVDKAVEIQPDLVGKKFRVRGMVEDGTVINEPGTLDTVFKIKHGAKLMTISYNQALPDTFKPGIEVIAEGTLGPDGMLVADNIIAKCPSKYEGGVPGQEGENHGPEGGY